MTDQAPSADSESIPSSVDADAGPLGTCMFCGEASRQAYTTAVCPDCDTGDPSERLPLPSRLYDDTGELLYVRSDIREEGDDE